MQLDPVRSNPELPVQKIEERDADNHSTAQANGLTEAGDLPATQRCRPGYAGWVWCLGDHRPVTITQHEMEVMVCLRPDQHYLGDNPEHPPLEWQRLAAGLDLPHPPAFAL